MREKWVWLALLLAVPIVLLQFIFGVRTTVAEQGIPLLTVLLMNEFGAVLCLIAVVIAVNTLRRNGLQKKLIAGAVAAGLCAVGFAFRIFQLYPGS